MSATNPSPTLRWLSDDSGWKRFEVSSRGDHVVVRVHLPEGPTRPLVWVLADSVDEVTPLSGLATATLDLPLLGQRSSPKWSERLRRCLAEGPNNAADGALLDEFETQSSADLIAAMNVCAERPEIDSNRVGLLGKGAGAWVAARLIGSKLPVAALALCGEGLAAGWEAGCEADGAPPCFRVDDLAAGAARLGEALGG